jgi:hypothetical protein
MQNTKNLAMMFLLGTFLTGGVLGFSAERFINRDRVCSSNPRSQLAERLQLSPGQQASVDSILDARSRQYQVVLAPMQERLDSIKERARDQIRRVLTAEQRAEFEALIQGMRDSTRRQDN